MYKRIAATAGLGLLMSLPSAQGQETPVPTHFSCRQLSVFDKTELNGQLRVEVGPVRAVSGRPTGEFTVAVKDLGCRTGMAVGSLRLRASMTEQPFDDLYLESRIIEVLSQFGKDTPTLFFSGRAVWRDRDGKRGGEGRFWLEWFFLRPPWVLSAAPASGRPRANGLVWHGTDNKLRPVVRRTKYAAVDCTPVRSRSIKRRR
jgi:hypothetical protein